MKFKELQKGMPNWHEKYNKDFVSLYENSTIAQQVADNIYAGADLTVKFADEIAGAPSEWDWIKARINAADFDGIHIGDYIPFIAGGNLIKAEVAGIDTYYNYGTPATDHHIDFISRDCWPDAHIYNKATYNNGTTVSSHPWLASDLYAWLNSLQMNVPNAVTINPALVAVDYRTTGVYDKLPSALKNVISPKQLLLPTRYSSGVLLTADSGHGWVDVGKLWIPSEIEVFGRENWGSKNGYSSSGFQQYPLFANNMKCIKNAGDNGGHCLWWLMTSAGGNSTSCAHIGGPGGTTTSPATDTRMCVPLCFRIKR